MASYSNPYAQGRPIKTRGSTIAKGIARMANQFGQDAAAKKAKQQRDVDEAEALLTGRSNIAESQYLKGYDAMKGDIDKFSDNLSDENKNVFQEEIKKLLIAGRDDLTDWIRDNPEAGMAEIKFRVEESLQGLETFRTDLAHLNEARKQWEAAKDLKPGEEGSIVGNYNPELIKLFEAQDRNDQNINLTMDDGNKLRFSLVNEEELSNAMGTAGDNDIIEFTTVNLTDLNNQAAAGGGYFRTVEKPDFTDLREQIKQEIISGNTEFGTAKDGKIVSINEDVVTDYINGAGKYENQPNGRGTFATYMDEEDQSGNWLYYGDDVEMSVPDGQGGSQVVSGRTKQLNNFNPDMLRDYMVTDFVDSFGNVQRNNTSTPPPRRRSNSSKTDTKKDTKKEEEVVLEGEVVESDETIDLKNPMNIPLEDFDKIKDEASAIKLLEKFSDDFEFGEMTAGKDAIFIKSKHDPSKEIVLDLNTEYNKNKKLVPTNPNYGKYVYESINKFIRENQPTKKSNKSKNNDQSSVL